MKKKRALRDADKYGGLPKFPSITESLNLATKSYQRLLLEDKWTKSKPAPALNVTPQRGNPQPGRRHGGIKCWNGCGQTHPYSECTQPIDEARVERNKKAFYEAKKARQASNPRPPRGPLPCTKMSRDGKPLVLNSKGLYVLDKKAMQRETAKQLVTTTAALNTMINKALDGTLPGAPSPPDSSTTLSPSPSTPDTAAVNPSSYFEQV